VSNHITRIESHWLLAETADREMRLLQSCIYVTSSVSAVMKLRRLAWIFFPTGYDVEEESASVAVSYVTVSAAVCLLVVVLLLVHVSR
jgi:hypothetical protein